MYPVIGIDIDPVLIFMLGDIGIIFHSLHLFMICYEPLTYLMVTVKYI